MTKDDERVLRKRWHQRKGQLAPEWDGNFQAFKAWAENNGWKPGIYIVAAPGALMGPDTARLIETRRCREKPIYQPIPGYSHRPCLVCGRKESTCTNPCEKYIAHYDATLERAREIAYRGIKRKR